MSLVKVFLEIDATQELDTVAPLFENTTRQGTCYSHAPLRRAASPSEPCQDERITRAFHHHRHKKHSAP